MRGGVIQIDPFDNFKVVCGTVDVDNPTALFVNLSGWYSAIADDINYDRAISSLNKAIKSLLERNLNGDVFNTKRFIVDLEMKSKRIDVNKNNFMQCEITILQKNNFKIDELELRVYLNDIVIKISQLFDANQYFKFSKLKVKNWNIIL